jgi:hypothetical protein
MSSRVACLAIVALLMLQGCTTTTVHAIVAPNEALIDDSGCFRQCQQIHPRDLGCLRACQGVRIVDDQQCGQVSFDAQRYQCSTALQKSTSPVAFIVIGLLAILVVFGAIFVSNFHSAYSGSD